MKKYMTKLLSIVLSICLLCSTAVFAQPLSDEIGSEDSVTKDMPSSASPDPLATDLPEEDAKPTYENQNTGEATGTDAGTAKPLASEPTVEPEPDPAANPHEEELDENGLPTGYDQSLIDEINNNSIDMPIEEPQEANEVLLSADEGGVTLAADDTMKDEYKAELVTAPFNIKNSNKESVSLSSGALTLQKNIVSLPGKNGLDFDLSINYNSGNAVITESKYSDTNLRHETLTDFAIGWSFNFPKLDLGFSPYGYPQAPNLQLADGSSYEVDGTFTSQQGEIECSLKNYLLDDMKLIRSADHSEFILTYTNTGRVDTFDGEYGNIKEIKDRFGNTITFQYEDRDFYQGSFFDYFLKPSSKLKKVRVLTQIVDSIGRHIHVNYHDSTVLTGKKLDYIEIILEDTPILKLNIDQDKGYYGDIDVLTSITEADGLTTRYTYEEKITHKTDIQETALPYSAKPSYYGNGSYYVLTRAEYPTGGYSDYKYLPARRSYGKVVYDEIRTAWYEVYKISECSDSTGDVTTYDYEGDRSGYPIACPIPSNVIDPDYISGDIYTLNANEQVNYHTIIRKNNLCTIYTFDKKHNLILNQKLDDTYEISTYLNKMVALINLW